MACRQSLRKKAIHLRRWYHPSLSHIVYNRSEKDEEVLPQIHIQSRSVIMRNTSFMSNGRHGLPFCRNIYPSGLLSMQCFGPSFPRFLSTEVGKDSNSVLTENAVEIVASQVPAVSEVAVAAADSASLVAALQYLIDGVRSFTGLNWWGAIAVTTILIRGVSLPLLINRIKATHKLNLLKPHLEEIKRKVQETGRDPIAVANGRKETKALFAKYGVNPLTPMQGLLIQGPIFVSFFLAITNMVEKVPSYKTGGAFWFTDLTTPDTLCIFPLLGSLSFLITVECNVQEGMEGSTMAGPMKKFLRITAILAIPLTMGFPKALFCYWIPSNLFSLAYGLAIKHPRIKRLLDLPGASTPSASESQSTFSALSSLQQHHDDEEPIQSPDSIQGSNRRAVSQAVMKQRIRHLEQQLKGVKKNKKTGKY